MYLVDVFRWWCLQICLEREQHTMWLTEGIQLSVEHAKMYQRYSKEIRQHEETVGRNIETISYKGFSVVLGGLCKVTLTPCDTVTKTVQPVCWLAYLTWQNLELTHSTQTFVNPAINCYDTAISAYFFYKYEAQILSKANKTRYNTHFCVFNRESIGLIG